MKIINAIFLIVLILLSNQISSIKLKKGFLDLLTKTAEKVSAKDDSNTDDKSSLFANLLYFCDFLDKRVKLAQLSQCLIVR